MKINDGRYNTIAVGSLSPGDLFEWKGVIYMRTNVVNTTSSKSSVTVVVMDCGRAVEMYCDVEVVAVQGELRI